MNRTPPKCDDPCDHVLSPATAGSCALNALNGLDLLTFMLDQEAGVDDINLLIDFIGKSPLISFTCTIIPTNFANFLDFCTELSWKRDGSLFHGFLDLRNNHVACNLLEEEEVIYFYGVPNSVPMQPAGRDLLAVMTVD